MNLGQAPNADEPFEYFDENGVLLGVKPRAQVHAEGLWHKSAHVFVFNDRDELLIQKRAADKDLYAGVWDYSVGEHLQPGEGFESGAHRGLNEELGISNVHLEPLGDVRWSRWQGTKSGQGFIDCEIQQAFCARYVGPVKPDPIEIALVWQICSTVLRRWVALSPESFTPWFVDEVSRLDWFLKGS